MALLDSGSGGGGDDEPRRSTNFQGVQDSSGGSIIPQELLALAAMIREAGSFTDLVINILIRFVIGLIIGIVLNVAAIIGTVFDLTERALVAAAGPLDTVAVAPISIAADTVWTLNLQLASSVLGAGVLAGPLALALIIAELAVVVRLTGPTLLAFGELVSIIPIVGNIANAGIVFAVELVGGVPDG